MSETPKNICPRCAAVFVCGAGQASCWCAELPALLKVPDAPAACYCPDCLRQLLEAQRRVEVGKVGKVGEAGKVPAS